MLTFPNDKQRHLILGKTGSGKTRAAVYGLSRRRLHDRIWIVLNHKGEELIDSIDGGQSVELDFFPTKPGLYIYHPVPEVDDEAVTSLMWKIHARGDIGLYIDEGYMIGPRDPAMQAIFTQGRSKYIPTIVLSQRPVWLSRFAVSEADFFQVFQLTDKRDRQTINSFIPTDLEYLMQTEANVKPLLPIYHSLWYDVGGNQLVMLKPVPTDNIILDAFKHQLPSTRKIFL
jgi:hypothetical protein